MSPAETVCAYVAAFNACDTAKLRALFSPAAVIHGVLGCPRQVGMSLA